MDLYEIIFAFVHTASSNYTPSLLTFVSDLWLLTDEGFPSGGFGSCVCALSLTTLEGGGGCTCTSTPVLEELESVCAIL